jgi:hypothetical protein
MDNKTRFTLVVLAVIFAIIAFYVGGWVVGVLGHAIAVAFRLVIGVIALSVLGYVFWDLFVADH